MTTVQANTVQTNTVQTNTVRAGTVGSLRDLTDLEFTDRYRCDRFTASVLTNRFRYLIQHVCGQLLMNAFSPIIRESSDLSAMLSGPPSLNFAMPSVSETIPLFFGSIPDAVRIALVEFGVEDLSPGDVIIVNDPYRVGTHVNDVCFIRPAFHHGELVGAVTSRAHMLDWGGRAMGGFEVTKVDVYEDGLYFPPTLLFHNDKPVKSTFNLILDNTRFGAIVMPDIRSIHTALQLGEELLSETIDKYGMDAYLGAIEYACDSSAETMRNALSRLPDGIYEGEERLDGDGLTDGAEYVVRVRINKRGGRAEFDLSNTSTSSPSAINCSWADAKTAVAIALKFLIDPKTPYTSATMRDVDVLAPPDSIVNTMPPHCPMFYWEPVLSIINATFKALNPVLGVDAVASDSWGGTIHMAHGNLDDGSPWFSSAAGTVTPSGPWGATKHGDGDSTQLMLFLNMIDGGVERAEADNPLVVMRRDYIADTAGPGLYRSGAASIADTYWQASGEHRVSTFHIKRPPGAAGVNGGGAGSLAGAWLWEGGVTGEGVPAFLPLSMSDPMYAKATPLLGVLSEDDQQVTDGHGTYHYLRAGVPVGAGSTLRFVCNGAGGWGDPLERDPELVRRDVRDEYVSIDGAHRDYGVVITGDPANDPENLVIDLEATNRRRASMREARDLTPVGPRQS